LIFEILNSEYSTISGNCPLVSTRNYALYFANVLFHGSYEGIALVNIFKEVLPGTCRPTNEKKRKTFKIYENRKIKLTSLNLHFHPGSGFMIRVDRLSVLVSVRIETGDKSLKDDSFTEIHISDNAPYIFSPEKHLAHFQLFDNLFKFGI
jgi:hypothetical protein